nr:MAG TPA: hypothetical protein [Caudoviricetes sp.]
MCYYRIRTRKREATRRKRGDSHEEQHTGI